MSKKVNCNKMTEMRQGKSKVKFSFLSLRREV